MFCDLVNSAKLSGQLDPEDLRDVIGAYQQACAESIRRYDGFVARYVGDGLLICFGYPIAHEDDAERSVRAGFEVIDAVSSLNEKLGALPEMKLRVRVGIATGLVVVGDLIADGVLDKDAIVGEAANLAARLQEMASPNSIIVSSNTRRLAADRFDYRDLGIRGIKGFAKPLPVYQVTGERRVTRFEARNAALTTLVDRHEEMKTLLRAWKDAESGSGQVVILCGEAGIGKSRIAAELYNRISGTSQRPNEGGASPLTFQCSPYHANAPLYPVIRYIEQLAGIDRLDSSAQRLGKLQAVMGSGSDDNKILPLIGELLDLDLDLGAPVPAVGAAAKRYLTIEALLDWCAARVKNGVPVITFEDAHWIDPTSTLLLNELVKWVRGQSVILIITLRTSGTLNAARFVEETLARNSNTSHVTICEVQDLDEGDTRQLVAATAGDRTLSQSQFDDIIAKSAGIPLYVEELAKAVIHGIPLSSTRDDSDQMEGGVPNTIRDALMAHLDQLGDAKQAAQFASVIGPEFSLDVLAKIMRRPSADLIAQLENLIRLRIVVPVVNGSYLYRFRHSLFRDISYRSLLRRRRRQLHLIIAEEYAQRESESLNASSDLIAQHYSLGEAHLEAIVHWLKGAKKAIERSAHEEALAMLGAAFLDIDKLEGPKRLDLELDLTLTEAMALRSLRGYSDPDVEERLIRARRLCADCLDASNRFNVEWGLFQCTIVKGDIIAAHQLATDLFHHAEYHPDRPFIDAHLASGMVAFHFGNFEAAMSFLEKGVSVSSPETDHPHFFTHGQSPGLFCISYLARTQCFLGYLDRARTNIERGLAIAASRAHDPGHIYGYVNALIHAVRVYHLCGDLEAEKRMALLTVETARRNHYAYYEALGLCHLGWVAGAEGSLREGIDMMVDGLSALAQTGTELGLTGFYVLLSQLNLRAGKPDRAREALGTAARSGNLGTRIWDADIERARGDILFWGPATDLRAAENAYRTSLAIARQQGAGLLVLKAALSLARLLQTLGRQEEGRAVLKHGLEQMQEGSDTQIAREARTVLSDLAGTIPS